MSKLLFNKSIIVFLLCNLIFIAALSVKAFSAESELVVRYNQFTLFDDNSDQRYFSSLLKIALDETVRDYGPYRLEAVDINMVQQRTIVMLKANENIDLLWTVTSIEREQGMQAVYFPLLKGLMGNRIFLIRKNEQHIFDMINTLQDLSMLAAGQGDNWPDTQIIKDNELPVRTAKAESLYKMLENNRFDYFPRSISEISKEITQYPELTIEKKLMLQYLSPIYFFVNKKNVQLAKRIEVGLLRALDNGKFEQIFRLANNIELLNKKLGLHERRIFKLNNIKVSEKTKALRKDQKFWIFN